MTRKSAQRDQMRRQVVQNSRDLPPQRENLKGGVDVVPAASTLGYM
jgi:hypothetical protein